MKTLFICILAVLLSMSAMVYSKGHGNHNMSPEQRVERMTDKLGLDASQQQQVLQIFIATQTERETIKQQMQALHEQTRSDVSAVLTAEQQALFAKMGPRGKDDRSKCGRSRQ